MNRYTSFSVKMKLALGSELATPGYPFSMCSLWPTLSNVCVGTPTKVIASLMLRLLRVSGGNSSRDMFSAVVFCILLQD